MKLNDITSNIANNIDINDVRVKSFNTINVRMLFKYIGNPSDKEKEFYDVQYIYTFN